MSKVPNIRRQILGPLDELGGEFTGKVGLHVTASDGRSITLTREEILTNLQSRVGARAIIKPLTVAWVKAQIEAALGAEQVPAARITHDIDGADGTPTVLEVR